MAYFVRSEIWRQLDIFVPPIKKKILYLGFIWKLNIYFEKIHLGSIMPNSRLPFFICFYVAFCRNGSLGIGMCSQGQWEKLSKGPWVQSMSFYDHKILDIRMAPSSIQTLEVSIEEGPFFTIAHFSLLPVSLTSLTPLSIYLSILQIFAYIA